MTFLDQVGLMDKSDLLLSKDLSKIGAKSTKKPCPRQESELPCGVEIDEHSADYAGFFSAHLEDSDSNPRQHEHQGQLYRQRNPAYGDELLCAVEQSAERVS